MNNRLKPPTMREMIAQKQSSTLLTGIFAFLLSGLLTFLIARSEFVAAGVWFSVIFSVAVGMLVFCCVRVWLDERSFDASDAMSYVVLTGTLSFIGIILTYITLEVFPFGNHTVLIIDMHHQYVAFFSLLREKTLSLFSGGSLVYSDSLGLGSSFLSLFSYYLSSPFNLLMLLFPREALTEAIALATVLKITAGGVTFAVFAHKVFKRNDFSIVAGGVAYSMIAFFIGHSWNLMWLDPLILLPLVCVGLHELIHKDKPLLYCITLAMTMLTNYYIGYMVCIFLVLYYIATEIGDDSKPSMADRLRRFWRFAYGSLVGGGISAVLVIPTFISLMSTSGAEDQFARELDSNFSLFSLFQRTLFSAYPSMRGDNLPNIYCSVLAVLLLALFLSCDKFSLRRRIAWGGLVGVLCLSLSVNWLNFAWHGFHFPNDLPYRFSFLVSFAMLCVGMQVLSNLSALNPKRVFACFGAILAMLMFEQTAGDGQADFRMIYVSLFFFAVYALVIGLHAAGHMRRALCCAVLAVFVFAEVTANASVLIQQLDANEYYTERNDRDGSVGFVTDYDINSRTVELVEGFLEDDDNMYRMEFLPRKTCNDPSLFGYSGITVFASSNPKSTTTLMGKLGYAINGVNSYLYKNYTPVSDSLMGVKYIVLQTPDVNYTDLKYTGQSITGPAGTRYVYQNMSALSKAYLVRNNIIEWNWESDNPYNVQNDFITAATGIDGKVWNMMTYSASSDGTVTSEDNSSSVTGYNCSVSINDTFFSMSGPDGSDSYEFTVSRIVPEDGMFSVYVDCRAAEYISISCNNGTYSSAPNEPNTIDLGPLPAGSSVDVTIRTELSAVVGNVFLASLNEDVFHQAVEELRQGQLTEVNYKEGRISGKVTCNNPKGQMMFTSLSYDSGWNVKIDGKKVDTFALGNGLLCFAVPEGEHTVTMTFCPTGLVAGIIISVVCILILLVLVIPALRSRAEELIGKILPDRQKTYRYAAGSARTAVPAPEGAPEEQPERDFSAEGFEAVDLHDVFDEEAFEGYEEYYEEESPAAGSAPVREKNTEAAFRFEKKASASAPKHSEVRAAQEPSRYDKTETPAVPAYDEDEFPAVAPIYDDDEDEFPAVAPIYDDDE